MPVWRQNGRLLVLFSLALAVMACLPAVGARTALPPAATATPQPLPTATSLAFFSPTIPPPVHTAPALPSRTFSPTAAASPTISIAPKPIETFLPAAIEPFSPANAARLVVLRELEVKNGYDAVYSPDGSRLYIRYYTDQNFRDGALAALDLKTGQILFRLALWAGKGTPEVWVSADGTKIATYKALAETAQMWDGLSGKPLEEIRLSPGARSFSLAPGWKTYLEILPEADPQSLRASLKEAGTQKELWKATLPGQPNPVSPAFSGDGAYAAISRPLSQTVLSTILDTASGKAVNLPQNVQFLSFSPDGKLLLARANERTIKIYESKTGTWKQDITFPESTFTGAEFSPDGKLIAAYYNYARLLLVDAASGKTVLDQKAQLWKVHFSPDGRLLVSVGEVFPRSVTLWGVKK
jgi:dipeptidyl aminopeptidase/acylaminoacyl peptidase